MTTSELKKLRQELRQMQVWAVGATVLAVALGGAAALLAAWSLAFWQMNPTLVAVLTPSPPPTWTPNPWYFTPTPYPTLWPNGTPTPALAPTLIVLPGVTAPEGYTDADYSGLSTFTLEGSSTQRWRFQPAGAFSGTTILQMNVGMQLDWSRMTSADLLLELRVWNRATGLWDSFPFYEGQNNLWSPEYRVGPAGEVYLELANFNTNPVFFANLTVALTAVDGNGVLFDLP